ncbi:hypothetical protein C7212DRAFT_354541 [Tuber magnatum]|uniref:Myb-like domain-containing protein n=1 Tax=Tuber magnatum TaxID=42249 RepID=A0A317SET5_9PEZI|nr:hypothetical protein C7212DRAFT_354541 [Tuber magnatum]
MTATKTTPTPKEREKSKDKAKSNNDRQDQITTPGGRSYPTLLPSAMPPSEVRTPKSGAGNKNSTPGEKSSNRRVRRKWTEEETNDLIKGCHTHGVGNWKKVLEDPRFHFNGRSSVDLKDRFRTCFPKEYRKPNDLESEEDAEPIPGPAPEGDTIVVAPLPPKTPKVEGEKGRKKTTKTELHHVEVLEKLGVPNSFPKVQRRERREFTSEEDTRLLHGFNIHGAAWSKIQSDPDLQLSHRRGTDLRDRFRNAFPDRYESAGFKARPRQRPKPPRSSSNGKGKATDAIEANGELEDRRGAGLEGPNKSDSASLLMQSLLAGHLSPGWGTGDTPVTSSDQSPAPGSLALDPALNEGFSGTTLEQITEEFLAVAQGNGKEPAQGNGQEVSHDMVRWEDMANNPIFDIDPSITGNSTTPHPQTEMGSKEPVSLSGINIGGGAGPSSTTENTSQDKVSVKRLSEEANPETIHKKRRIGDELIQ